ncbi:MAG: hypothetical protein IJQ97_03360, partial [Paludibacteraceae bacterium]|nr:hypothetical protein [Paludibacteraceae bacterium]
AVEYEIAYSATGAKGGTERIILPAGSKGQYMRLLCKTRSTGYGSSLYEIEVYGSGRCEPIVYSDLQSVADEPMQSIPQAGEESSPSAAGCKAQKVMHEGRIYILKNGKLYTVMGQKVAF